MLAGRAADAPLLHESWGDNVFLETNVEVGVAKALDAPTKCTRDLHSVVQCMEPCEGRGLSGAWTSSGQPPPRVSRADDGRAC